MHHKKTALSAAFILAIVVTSALVFFASRELYAFIGENIREEQLREQDKLLEEVFLLQKELLVLEEVIEKQKTRSLYANEKEDVLKHLHVIEEKALNIERMNLFYPQDLSIHLVQEFKNEHTDAIFDHARNLHLLAQRFVRAQERLLFENYTTALQRAETQKYYDDLSRKIATLCANDRYDLPPQSVQGR